MSESAWHAIRNTILLAAMIPSIGLAQLFPVEPIEKGFFSSSGPTMTFLYEAKGAKATLVFIPGGDGNRGVKPTWDASHPYFASFHYNRMLQSLTDPSKTSGHTNVVIFDSPISLGDKSTSARGASDHLSRIESVVLFYREKLGTPVWIMGHSNGSVSITEFYKYLKKNKKENQLSGLIYSAGKIEASFGDDVTIPVLLIHHAQDGCFFATPAHTEQLFNKLRQSGNLATEFVLIRGGEAEPRDACHSGYHMYFGANDEVANAIDQFMTKHITSP